MDQETKTWAMILHLSVFAGYVVPFAGLVAPILIWQLKKQQLPAIDAHGKEVANFLISMFIYGVAAVALSLLLIGIPIALALVVAGVVLPIMGAIKANNGDFFRYPWMIRLF